jgi:acetyltransferase-like isoleucine patch superfamily enzyme
VGGLTVGNGAAIGSMAVVTKDVLPFEVVVGNPAKHLKFRFPPDIIS